MNITVDIIRDILSDSCEVTQYGRSLHGCPLRIPRFYNAYSPVEEGGVYILRSCDLPGDLREKCLFICFDAPPVLQHYRCQSEILYLHGDNLNYLSIMNTVQGIFDRLLTWQDKMQKIVNTDCDIEKMVQKSIPVFENRITIIDYNLNILAYCESRTVDGILYDEMNCSVRQVPKQKSFLFNLEGRREIYLHEPYHIPEPDTGIDNYCINLFLDNEYMGTCALMQDNRPIRPSDYLLFQQFAAFVNATISRQSSRAGDKYVTLKDLLRRLLDSMPVSRSELNTALGKSDLGGDKKNPMPGFVCMTLQSINHDKLLPEGYLCSTVEQLFSACTALSFDGDIVCIIPANKRDGRLDNIRSTVDSFLRDLNFHAGCSLIFNDLFKLRTAYQQSLCAIRIGDDPETGELFFPFSRYLLDYMLQNCCGAFSVEDLMIPELRKLMEISHSVDYWETLKSYLDHECNASETAEDMYLHRTSILPRLKKIRSIIDLDSEDTRLLLRIYMKLYHPAQSEKGRKKTGA